MASTFASQLAQLAAEKPPQERYVRGKPSLLFDYQKAADVSAETLLSIAQAGLEVLTKSDKRFSPFADSLFSRSSVSLSREQLTAVENETLNANLGAFLRVLTNHFLTPAAFQVLEYCIRRYKVHVLNVDDVMLCGLPYHSTPEFARLVVLLQLKGTTWEWLSPAQQSGAPPPREALVRRCVNDQAVLRAMCKGAQALGVPGFVSKTFLAFYAVLLCEVLAAVPRVSEDLVTLLLPFLAAGLKEGAAKEYRSATLMVLTQLLARAQLSGDFLRVVSIEVVRSWSELGGSTVLMMLTHLAASQPHWTALPIKALQVLSEHDGVAADLADLQSRKANLAPLLKLILPSLTQALINNPDLHQLLGELLRHVSFEAGLVQPAAMQLLQAGAALAAATGDEQQQQQQHQDGLIQVLRVLDLHYPEQLDAAINAVLQEASAAATAADATGHVQKQSKSGKKQKHQGAARGDALFDFVQCCFAGSRHEVLPADGAAAAQQQALTLSVAVSAPASEMRIMALQKLDAICSCADAPSSTQQLLQSSLLSCLRDDVFAVSTAAASAKGLAAVPAEQQLPALQYLLQRAAAAIAVGHASSTASPDVSSAGGAKDALKAAKAALAAVAGVGELAAADGASRQQAAALLLEYALADKRSKKLARAAVKVAVSCSWSPLLQALAAAPAVTAAVEGVEAGSATAAADAIARSSKRRKKGDEPAAAVPASPDQDKHAGALVLNRAVVAALADAVTATAGGSSLLQETAAVLPICGPRCRQLLLLVLAKAAAEAASAPADATAEASGSKGRGKGPSKAGKQSSSQHAAESGPASSAQIAAVLVDTLEQQLAAAGSSNSSVVVPSDWQTESQQLLDATGLPTKQHIQQLPGQLQHVNGVVLLWGLQTALEAAPAAALAPLLGQPVQLFARLASASAQLGPAGQPAHSSGLQLHITQLVRKSCESAEHQLAFLSNIYGLPAGLAGETAQVMALQLLPSLTADDSNSMNSSSWFVRLLAAVNSSSKAVRTAAVQVLLALPPAVTQGSGATWWCAEGSCTEQQLQELISAVQQQVELLTGSAGAFVQLLTSAAADATAMDVEAAGPDAAGSKAGRSRRASKTGAAKSSKGNGTEQQSATVQLSTGCMAALQRLLLATLPQLHHPADLPAARLAVSVLAAADSTAAAPAAEELLNHLQAELCQHTQAAAAAATAKTSSSKAPAWQQLVVSSHLGATAVAAAAAELQQLRTDVAVSLLPFFTAQALKHNPASASTFVNLLQLPFNGAVAAGASAAAADNSNSSTQPSAAQLAAVAPVRAAALQQLTPAAFNALSQDQQQAAFTAALQTLAADGDAGCRAAARHCLEQLPVTAAMLLVLLQAVGGEGSAAEVPQPKAKRSRRTSTVSQDVSTLEAPASGVVTSSALDAATAALEFLQWREDVTDRQQLLQPLQHLLRQVIPLMGSIAETHNEEQQQQEEDDDDFGAAAAAGTTAEPAAGSSAAGEVAAASVSPSAAGYAAQSTLLVLEQLAKEQLANGAKVGVAAGSGFDADLVLSCASAAPDGAVRNAALLLMAVLAQLSPEDVLEHVLKALSVIQHSAAFQADAHSQAVASSTLAALVPAWLAAGRGSEELWGSLLLALPGLPALRRITLLEALLAALPQDLGLPVGLLLMMQHLVESSSKKASAAAAAASPGGITPEGKKSRKVKKLQATSEAAAAPSTGGGGGQHEDEEVWLPELMAALCEKVAVPERLAAFAAVLESSLCGADGPVAAHTPLPRLAVSFVAANLKAKSVVSAIAAAKAAAHSGLHGPQATLQDACKAIMTQALLHLLQLNPTAAAAAGSGSSSNSTRRLQKAINAAADGVYGLLSALEAVQDAPSYLLALVEMSKQDADNVQRRALKLLSARLLKAELDLADLEVQSASMSAAEKLTAHQELAEAGLAICHELPRLLQPSIPAITRQLALVAADAGIRLFGKLLPSVVLASMLVVLQAAGDAAAPVRASALACIASGVAAIGTQLVPLLPQTAKAVLAAAETAVRDLAALKQQQTEQGTSSSDEGGSEEEEDGHQEGEEAAASAGKSEEAALELAGALAALEALMSSLGPFMSPYLRSMVQLLLHPVVLSCTVAGANAAAGRLRTSLPAKVPARLLMEPLLSQWDYALAACRMNSTSGKTATAEGAAAASAGVSAAPAVSFLELVAATASSLEPAVAVMYHEQISALLLQALDTRSRWLAAAAGQQQRAATPAAVALDGSTAAAAAASVAAFSPGAVFAVESAAVRALTALVMKLSESKFKPLFLRMVDWTNAVAGDAQQHGIGRVVALFAAVCAFSHRLRSVFAPYYKYFLVLLMKQLAGDGLSSGGSKRPKKKRKSLTAAAADSSSSSDGVAVSAWLARLHAVRAVHLLALHEGTTSAPAAQQEHQERFDKLLPLLVEVLAEGPPAAVAALLSAEGADTSLDVPGGPVAALGQVGKTVVDAGGRAALDDACDIVGTAAVGALLQMAIAGGSDVIWKPLHHALLIATRGGTVRAKLLSLGAVSRLVELLREEYLMLLPEALPFIAELIEDGELAVEAAAQGLVAQMEALSGERLEQYLKA